MKGQVIGGILSYLIVAICFGAGMVQSDLCKDSSINHTIENCMSEAELEERDFETYIEKKKEKRCSMKVVKKDCKEGDRCVYECAIKENDYTSVL